MIKVSFAFTPFVGYLNIPPLAPALLKACMNPHDISTSTFDFNAELQLNINNPEIKTWISIPEYTLSNLNFQIYQKFIQQCAERMVDNNPDVIAISVFSHESHKFAEDLCYRLKTNNPNCYVMLGGSGVQTMLFQYQKTWGQMMLDNGLADSVLAGEGENTIVNVVKEKIKGWITIDQLNNSDFLDMPIPDFSDYNWSLYGNGDISKVEIPITASKGCVRSCSFCDVAKFWPRYRFRSGELVANEIIEIYQKYNITTFIFTDSLINGGMKPFRQMNEVLADRIPTSVKYSGQFICRDSKSMLPRDFELMRLGGCKSVNIGIESGSESVRNHMRKGFSDKDLHYTAENLIEQKINQVWNIMVGYPTESDSDWNKTLELIKHYHQYRDLVKINPIGIFQLLNNTPITTSDMLSDLAIHNSTTQGYSGFNWISQHNSQNTLTRRVARWHELLDLITQSDMLGTTTTVVESRTEIINNQLHYYKNASSKTFIPIQQESFQAPATMG
jgi:hypothetical protein